MSSDRFSRDVSATLYDVRNDYGDPLARWFITEGYKIADTAEFITQCGEQLHAHGIPLFRLGYIQRTLHPELIGYGYFWRRGHGTEVLAAGKTVLEGEDYRDNPLPKLFEEGRTVREHLENRTDLEAPLLRQLRDEGATDYVALPVVFSDGHIDGLSVASDRPGGFSRNDLDRMYALQFLFARIVEIHNLRTTAVNLLDTYVGHDAGERILKGQIERGAGETLQAVVCFCDLKGFTRLSDRLPRDTLIALLNDYFTCVAEPAEERGGEVLKFIGDAVLLIYRLEPGADVAAVAASAMDAAGEAVRRCEALCAERERRGEPGFSFGMSVHVGDVMYGNIGAPSRLDFTVIGPAVNLAARIESLSRELDHPVLVSAQVAALHPERVRTAGNHLVKGLDTPVEVFALDLA